MSKITFIEDGIIRIQARENMPESYLEKYGIITVPATCECPSDLLIEKDTITLPGGKVLNFSLRSEDTLWENEINYMHRKFQNAIPFSRIQGRPESGHQQGPCGHQGGCKGEERRA